MEQLAQKLQQLQDNLLKLGKDGLVICFSGGVDSTLVAAAAAKAGLKPLLLTFATPTISSYDLEHAQQMAGQLGLKMLIHNIDTLALPAVKNNTQERCYYCKQALYRSALQIAQTHNLAAVADGNNADDMLLYRPGLAAAEQLGIAHPLVEAKLTKAQIRALAKQLGLSNYARPAAPCLVSRFPYQSPLTEANLRQVEQGEQWLREIGLSEFRLRTHGRLARLEVAAAEQSLALAQAKAIVSGLTKLGWRYVSLDLAGLQSGSSDAELAEE